MKFFKKKSNWLIITITVFAVLTYFFYPPAVKVSSSGTSAEMTSADTKPAEKKEEMETLDFSVATPPDLKPTETTTSDQKTHAALEEPENPLCPSKTSDYKVILKCPDVPDSIKKTVKKQNYATTKEDCDLASRTTRFTLGKKFIAWTLIQSNSCENKTYPHGLPEEITYNLQDEKEVVFPNNFSLLQLEKHYLKAVDLKSAWDLNGRKCQSAKAYNRRKSLGSLESDLTKAQFRFVDAYEKNPELQIQSFTQDPDGKICMLNLQVKEWRTLLTPESEFQGTN